MARPKLDRVTQGFVVRLVNTGVPDHFPPNADKPLPAAFRPSSGDEEDAAERNLPVLVSVWVSALTSANEAIAFLPERKWKPFKLPVAGIEAVAPARTEVLRDPHSVRLPGWEGHAGIAGLEQRSSEDKKFIKLLRSKLVDICTAVPPDEWNRRDT